MRLSKPINVIYLKITMASLAKKKKKRKAKENGNGFLEVDARYAGQDIRQFGIKIIFV